jgi:hypothetical protein
MDPTTDVDAQIVCAECGRPNVVASGPHGLPCCEECLEVLEELEATEQAEGD